MHNHFWRSASQFYFIVDSYIGSACLQIIHISMKIMPDRFFEYIAPCASGEFHRSDKRLHVCQQSCWRWGCYICCGEATAYLLYNCAVHEFVLQTTYCTLSQRSNKENVFYFGNHRQLLRDVELSCGKSIESAFSPLLCLDVLICTHYISNPLKTWMKW